MPNRGRPNEDDSDNRLTILAPKKEAAIIALLQQPTIEGAATQDGVSRATLFRWMNETAFQERLLEARQQATEAALRNLVELSGQAVQVLREVMQSTSGTPSARVEAARAALDLVFRFLPPPAEPKKTRPRFRQWIDDPELLAKIENSEGSATVGSDAPSPTQ
jgi:hypothetical protein